MGRQAYITRLALGRSAYEAPESELAESSRPLEQEEATRSVNDTQPESTGVDYVQAYDHRGHPINPTSKSSARTLIKAQNDVLATVGVCVGVHGAVHGAGKLTDPSTDLYELPDCEREMVELVMKENEVGLWIRSASSLIESAGIWPIVALKNRLQVLRLYSQVPIIELLKVQWRRNGAFAVLFPAVPAQGLSVVVGFIWDIISLHCHNILSRTLDSPGIYFRHPSASRRGVFVARALVEIVAYSMVYPFEIFVALQMLHLLPPYPLFPPFRSFIPFSSASPIQLPQLSRPISPRSIMRMIGSSLTSPFVMVWLYKSSYDVLSAFLSKIIMPRLIPRSDPDDYSIKAAMECGLVSAGIPWFSTSEYSSDGNPGTIGRSFFSEIKIALREAFYGKPSPFLHRDRSEQSEDGVTFSDLHRLPNSATEAELDTSAAQTNNDAFSADQIPPTILPPQTPTEAVGVDEEDDEEGGVGLSRPDDASNTEDHQPARTRSSSSSSSLPSRPTNAVRVSSIRHGNSETVTMEVEIGSAGIITHGSGMGPGNPIQSQQGLESQLAQPILDNGLTASPISSPMNPLQPPPIGALNLPGQDEEDPLAAAMAARNPSSRRRRHRSRRVAEMAAEKRRRHRHRVTALTTSPWYTMANLISNITAGWILMPFQTYINRSIAQTFLAAASTPEQRAHAAFFQPQIYPPTAGPFASLGAGLGSIIGLGLGRRSGHVYPGSESRAGHSAPSALAYVSKLTLCCAMEAAVGFAWWQVGWLVSTIVGIRNYGWGRM